ncbi:MAG: hypothetical protein ABIL40_07740 [candidate division WOR-3 bacterium]
MEKLSKSVKKRLRELDEIAYEKELKQYLEELYRHFEEWKQDKLDTLELNEFIHKYYNRNSQEAYKSFVYSDLNLHLARAVLNDLLKLEEIPDEVREDIFKLIGLGKEEDN